MPARVIIVHSQEEAITATDPGGPVGSPAHCFGPFESAEEAMAWENQNPDDCFKFLMDLVGPDPDDIDRSHDDEPLPPALHVVH